MRGGLNREVNLDRQYHGVAVKGSVRGVVVCHTLQGGQSKDLQKM